MMETVEKNNTPALEKKAVKAALDQNWTKAIKLNLNLLDIDSDNKSAKMRLGKAYLQKKKFSDAQKIFKQILKKDPINTIAKKNLELARNRNAQKKNDGIDYSRLIKEPGTGAVGILELTNKRLKAESFSPRENLTLRINKKSVNVLKDGKTLVGKLILPDLVKRLNIAKKKKAHVTASFHGGKDNVIKISLTSSRPVFKAERQELKPYMKKGSIEEPELVLPETT